MSEKPRIESIKIVHYSLPMDPPFRASWDPQPRSVHNSSLVLVRAGEFEGIGSGDAMLGFTGHESLFVGQDPFDIDRHVQVLDNLQFHYGRMWPLEVALWDLMARMRGMPLWQLLGGDSPIVPLYASTGQRRNPVEQAEVARNRQAEGFPAIKIRFHGESLPRNLAVVREVRQAIGSEMEILVDANQGWRMAWDTSPPWDLETALWMADGLAELDVYWLEEPLHRHAYRELAELRSRAEVRIAGGEGNRELAELKEYLHHGSLDVYQPDAVWSTGVLRGRRLAQEVQATGAIYSPHTWGDGMVMMANMHLAAAVSEAPFIEYPFDPPGWTAERRDFFLTEPIAGVSNGKLRLPDAPGLGVEVDWDRIEPLRIK